MTAPSDDDKKIEALRQAYKLSWMAAAAIALTSLYVVNNMDDGETFDLHQQVPKIMQEFKEIPEMRKVALTAELNEAASQKEQEIADDAALYSVLAGVNMLFFYKAMNNAIKEKDGPRVG